MIPVKVKLSDADEKARELSSAPLRPRERESELKSRELNQGSHFTNQRLFGQALDRQLFDELSIRRVKVQMLVGPGHDDAVAICGPSRPRGSTL